MTVDMYIWQQKDDVRGILDYVHHLLLHTVPEVEAAIKWGVPYYTLRQGLLYLNPIKKGDAAVEVCFTRGNRFEYGKELLYFKDRKLVGGYSILSLETIDEKVLKKLILEAVRLDKQHSKHSPWKKREHENR